jgi:hypothetical protein
LLSWPLRGIEITQGNLGGFFLLCGLYEKMNLPRIFFGGVYCLFKEVFLLGSIFQRAYLTYVVVKWTTSVARAWI